MVPRLTLSGSNYPYLKQIFYGPKNARAIEFRWYLVAAWSKLFLTPVSKGI